MVETKRTIGLIGATSIGVGAIVGGGIFVLAGVAFRAAGPGAILAFAINGAIAIITALSFAEMSSGFPVSGGAYVFAKRVLSVRAAFGVGWILWFAYIVAAVLYALGFASYARLAFVTVWPGDVAPGWLSSHWFATALAIASVAVYTVSLLRKTGGGGDLATVGKMVLFVVLLAAGFWVFAGRLDEGALAGARPFMPLGFTGVLAAMGFTFIAVQGFDLVAAVAGEVKNPGRTIPRAMLLSLGIAMVVYLPLLFLITTVGVPQGDSIVTMSEKYPETIMAIAAENFLGRPGYWIVVIAAILATLSALRANVLAASRVSASMAADRTLPRVLGDLSAKNQTPVMAIYASALTMVSVLVVIPDLAAAGAAASLIFLIAFFLAHVTSYLARSRGGIKDPPFSTPFFPVIPVVGGLACLALAVFQAIVVPSAGVIVLLWLGLGGILYLSTFASRAEAVDARAEAADPDLVRLRGRHPMVLVPVSNPASASALVAVANALAPPAVGRVVLLSVVVTEGGDPIERLEPAQRVLAEAMRTSLRDGYKPEALLTVAPRPWNEIERLVRTLGCESLLLGVTKLADEQAEKRLEELMNNVDCDVSFLHTPEGWHPSSAKRILVPIAGGGFQNSLRARLLASLCREAERTVTYLRVLPYEASDEQLVEVRRATQALAEEEVAERSVVEVVRSVDIQESIVSRAADHDIVVLGLQRLGRSRRVFSPLALQIARETPGATILLSRRPSSMSPLLQAFPSLASRGTKMSAAR